MDNLSKEQSIEKIEGFIKKHKLSKKLTLDNLKDRIYKEETTNVNGFINEILDIVMPKSEKAMFEAVDIAVTAWNTLPHKALGGKAPIDMLGNPVSVPNTSPVSSPFVAVYDEEFGYEAVEKIVKDVPFIEEENLMPIGEWANEVLPKFRKFLREDLEYTERKVAKKIKIIEEYLETAELDGCMYYRDISAFFTFHTFVSMYIAISEKSVDSFTVREALFEFADFLHLSGMAWK